MLRTGVFDPKTSAGSMGMGGGAAISPILFVGAHAEQSWAPIRSTVGVSGLVRFGGEAAVVPTALVDELRREAGGDVERHHVFKHGQAVRIVGTSYSSIEGIFQMQEGAERAQVLISLLGRPAVVTVPLSELVPE